MAADKVLLIDDEPEIRFALRDFLETHGFEVLEAESCAEAQEVFWSGRPDLALIDYRLGDGTALDLLPRLRQLDASVPLVLLTAHGSIDLAVQAIKEGAEQFLIKPVELSALLVIIRRLIEVRRLERKQVASTTREDRTQINPFLGTSRAIRDLAEQAHQLLQGDRPILIQGETGTGKSLLAAWLHRHGPRANEAFVDLNCAGLTREFLETELFGHGKGAFTGAVASKMGLLEVAHAGIVFLDEIGDMDPLVQAKLLKVVEEKRFRRLGEVRDRFVDIGIIAATHQPLATLVADGRFRSDFYYRINTFPLVVPPLRDRGNDIAILARSFLTRIAHDLGRPQADLTDAAERALLDYRWPGNVRELRNVLERAMLLSEGRAIDRRDLCFETSAVETRPETTQMTLQEVERSYIEQIMREENGKVEAAARRLGIPRSTLYQKLKVYGINLSRI